MNRTLLTSALAVMLGVGSTAALATPRWQTQGRNAADALNLLEAKGYGGFTGFHAVGKDFAANVVRDGRTVHLLVNPYTNHIRTSA
ncbi:MAG TPA: hypothetical protein VJK90_01220 [Acetobacteraceae bacterium]|jgi:hypothetical protein|nr:hypothetical protein [Acetobacteraceae bacterium]